MALTHRIHPTGTTGRTAGSAQAVLSPVSDRRRTTQPWRGPVWRVPVGLQLSLVYALLVAATLALLGWALYTRLEGFLVDNTAQRLDRFTNPILVRSFSSPGEPDSRGPHQSGSTLDQAASTLVRELSGADIRVAVLDAQGRVINSTQASDGTGLVSIPGLPSEWSAKIESGSVTQVGQWIVSEPGSERQLVVLTPLTLHSSGGSPDTPLYLEQITSLGAADAVLNQLRLYIMLGLIVGTAMGMLAGLALTRTILRPLDRMVRTAEAISDGELHRRLRLPPGRNEVARLGSAFDHMVDRLAEALETQKHFVADASHELRTPLTSLEGLSEMLLMGADRGDTRVVQRMVRSMHSELGRLGRLVADLLALSRLDSPAQPEREFVPTDVCRVLREVCEQMGPAAEARGISLAAHCEESVVVSGDPDRLKQVVLNLVSNALRYTPGGGNVSLWAEREKGREQEARIRVQDTGSGIAPGDLPHVFDRFYRGDPSRARATGSSGLGLAIVRGIVEAHGGSIAVQSVSGEGTCFTITLPSVQAAELGLPQGELSAIPART